MRLLGGVYVPFIPFAAQFGVDGNMEADDEISPFCARGRKLKFAPGARIVRNATWPSRVPGARGTVIEYLGVSQYRVKFDDIEQEEYLLSKWLEVSEGSSL